MTDAPAPPEAEGPSPPSIINVLDALEHNDDIVVQSILANAYNLFIDAKRRLTGSVVLYPEDMPKIYGICSVLLSLAEAERPPEAYKRRPMSS